MKDAQSIRERIVDRLMDGDTVNGARLHDILDGDLILGDELAFVFRGSSTRLERLSDLETKCRKIVGRYVMAHMDDEVRAELDADQCERDEFKRRMFA